MTNYKVLGMKRIERSGMSYIALFFINVKVTIVNYGDDNQISNR